MRINIASRNPAKVAALRETLTEYGDLKEAQIIERGANSGVSEQPKSAEETITGAINRAKAVFSDCDYSIGLESGLIAVPCTKTGYMDVCFCAIYDGVEVHLGASCAFECPVEITRMALQEGLDLNQGTKRLGLTSDDKIGNAEGLIGILTNNRVTRKDYTKQAIHMALIQIRNAGLYKEARKQTNIY